PIQETDLAVPENVRKWLGRLMLLYRVPFNYLVPDERMLPTDSIRFFYLDPRWLKCLLEGACSVGRTSAPGEVVGRAQRDNFLNSPIQEARRFRTEESHPAGNWTHLTGFLLRSPVVEGWQGLEMRAWEKWDPKWADSENDPVEAEKKKKGELKALR